MQPTQFQQAVLQFRQTANVANLGGRGSGKSVSLCLDVVDRCRVLQQHARPLITREQWSALDQLRQQILELSIAAFGTKCTVNKSEGVIAIPATNSVIAFSQLDQESSYTKHQGKTYCSLYHDEWANYGSQGILYCDRLRSNMRPPIGIRPHIHLTGNPMGRAHSLAMRRFVTKSPPGVPFQDAQGVWWIWFTSDFTMNPHLDADRYERDLTASASGDSQRLLAWKTGLWAPSGGQMFGQLNPTVHIIDPQAIEDRCIRPVVRAGGDWGLSAPATCLMAYILTHDIGNRVKAGSVVIVDECDTARSDEELHVGMEYPPVIFADRVRGMFERYGHDYKRVPWVMDDARSMTSSDTVVGMIAEEGFDIYKPASKDRPGTWSLINQMLSDAKTGAGPGLFISSRCRHLLETIEEAPRDENRPEDISAKWNRDHWVDALGYLCRDIMVLGVGASQGRVIGGY